METNLVVEKNTDITLKSSATDAAIQGKLDIFGALVGKYIYG